MSDYSIAQFKAQRREIAYLQREIERLRAECAHLQADLVELLADCQRMWLFIAEQHCECFDEYGNKRPQECDRCQLLRAAKAGGDNE